VENKLTQFKIMTLPPGRRFIAIPLNDTWTEVYQGEEILVHPNNAWVVANIYGLVEVGYERKLYETEEEAENENRL